MIRIKELKLNIRLKLFLINTPIIKIEKIDKVKNTSGSKIFKLLSILKLNQLAEKEFKNHPCLTLEYFEIADTETLKTAIYKSKKKKYRAFIASFIDDVRLIDNIALN